MEIETSQRNLNKDMQSNTETENKQIDTRTLSLEISGTRSSTRQKKAPKSMSNDFFLY
jgi:hypothetical protein